MNKAVHSSTDDSLENKQYHQNRSIDRSINEQVERERCQRMKEDVSQFLLSASSHFFSSIDVIIYGLCQL
jgi:hypothetical protein